MLLAELEKLSLRKNKKKNRRLPQVSVSMNTKRILQSLFNEEAKEHPSP